MDTKPTIALCLITKDSTGEGTQRAVHSARWIVDDVIIVHTGLIVPVNFPEIIKRAAVFHRPWDNSFSAARNYAISQTKCDLIFVLDDDEFLSIPSEHLAYVQQGLRKMRPNWPNFGFTLPIVSAKTGEIEDDIQYRVFPNHPQIRYTRHGHNMLSFIQEKHDYPLNGHIPEGIGQPIGAAYSFPPGCCVKHYGYLPELIFAKSDRAMRLLNLDLEEAPNNGHTHYYLAREFNRRGDLTRAKEHAMIAATFGEGEPTIKSGVYLPQTYALLAEITEKIISPATAAETTEGNQP